MKIDSNSYKKMTQYLIQNFNTLDL